MAFHFFDHRGRSLWARLQGGGRKEPCMYDYVRVAAVCGLQVESASWNVRNKVVLQRYPLHRRWHEYVFFWIVACNCWGRKKNMQWVPKRKKSPLLGYDGQFCYGKWWQGPTITMHCKGGHSLLVGWGGLNILLISHQFAVQLVQERCRSKRHFWNQTWLLTIPWVLQLMKLIAVHGSVIGPTAYHAHGCQGIFFKHHRSLESLQRCLAGKYFFALHQWNVNSSTHLFIGGSSATFQFVWIPTQWQRV